MAVVDGRRRRWRGLLVSRADVEACISIIRHPFHIRIPGNPGMWISNGIFQHDEKAKGLYYSERHVGQNRARWSMAPRSLQVPCYREKLEALKVTWPEPGPRDRWKLTVFSEASLDGLTDWRNGKVGDGQWADPNRLWSDSEGIWYSSGYLASLFGIPVRRVGHLRDADDRYGVFSRFKLVPRQKPTGVDRWQKATGRSICVHHEDEVRPVLCGMASMIRSSDSAVADHELYRKVEAVHALVESGHAKNQALHELGRHTTKSEAAKGRDQADANHKGTLTAIDGAKVEVVAAIGLKAKESPDESSVTFWHSGKDGASRSYSHGPSNKPKNVSPEMDSILQAFLDAGHSLETKDLAGTATNISGVMAKIERKFPGSVTFPPEKNDGYFIAVKKKP